jgi:hypothetical protein
MEHAADELDTYSMNAGHGKSDNATALREARAAVAELMEAARDVLPNGEADWRGVGAFQVATFGVIQPSWERFVAALARFSEN